MRAFSLSTTATVLLFGPRIAKFLAGIGTRGNMTDAVCSQNFLLCSCARLFSGLPASVARVVPPRPPQGLFAVLLLAFAFPALHGQSHTGLAPHDVVPGGLHSSDPTAHGVVRSYFIAAEEVDWDYSPHGRNIAGMPRVESTENDNPVATAHRIYHKAIYREYTDASFTHPKVRPPEWEHLGILGPLIRAEVGDSIRVSFRNNTHLSLTMHPHGVEYKKDAEGAMYNDGTTGSVKADDRVAPGATYTYIWSVPESAGPGPMDGSSVLWMYHSHLVEARDINTGLIGPIIVTARGKARPDGSPVDVDREFITDFAVFDETESWFFERNASWDPLGVRLKAADPLLREKNLLYTINGYIEGNLPMLTMKRGEHVRWYLLSNDNEDDVHAAHWHGNTTLWNNMRMDSVSLGPMAMTIADMTPENVGTWLFHCHVADHLAGGMVARYQVLP